MKISENARNLYSSIAKGWNTWDVASVTASVLLPQKLRVNVAVVIPERNAYSEDCLWDKVEDFGEHSIDGMYTCLKMKYMERKWLIETSAMNDELLIRVKPLEEKRGAYIVLEVSNIWDGKNAISYAEDGVEVFSAGKKYYIRALNSVAKPIWNPSYKFTIAVKDNQDVYFTVNSQKNMAEVDNALKDAEERWLNSTIHADGDMGKALAATRRSLLWNLVYDSRNKRPITPVSRNWCTNRGRHFGDYVIFEWDTFFAALLYGLFSKELAYATFFSILEEITPEGMIPNFGSGTGQSRDRSEPQVGALCAWKLYIQYGDKWFLKECFSRLLQWNRWRFENRDFNKDGLLELASTPYDADYDEIVANGAPSYDGIGDIVTREQTSHMRRGAMWESGLDNSPMWDRAVYNPYYHCLELSYAGLNSLMVMDCRILAKIGREIGEAEDTIAELEKRAQNLSEKINQQLWCEEKGTYLNRHWSGEFDPAMSPTHFYTWLTGNITPERSSKMLAHLLNEEEFWGKYVIPMTAKNESAYMDQDYWRGRIWAPTNYLVGEALLNAGYQDVWLELVKKGYDMFLKEWKDRNIVGENYNAITGKAAEKVNSDKFYHWGALLIYMVIQVVVNFDIWEDRIKLEERPEWIESIWNISIEDRKINIL